MKNTLPSETIAWLEDTLGPQAQLQSAQSSPGATSSEVYFVTVLQQGQTAQYVLRCFTNSEWLVSEPDLPQHEAAALHKAHQAGLPAPDVLAFTKTGGLLAVPALLMDFMPGEIELQPPNFDDWLEQLALALVQIHQHLADDLPWQYSSWTNTENIQPPAWSKYPQLWEKAIEIRQEPQPAYQPVFIHRDYHPTNILWRQGQVSAVVDWVNACAGPTSVDIAHCRANLTFMYGADVAQKFLDLYTQIAGPDFEFQPYFEIDSILDCREPGYYRPWRAYGLGEISQPQLQARLDERLRLVLENL